MSFKKLETAEKLAIRQTMLTILNEDLIADFEFQTRLGVEKRDLAVVIDSYPNIDDARDDSLETLSINNCLNELCFGVKAPENAWERIGVTRQDLLDIYKKWADLRGWMSTGIR